jgi:hypothetical protein
MIPLKFKIFTYQLARGQFPSNEDSQTLQSIRRQQKNI